MGRMGVEAEIGSLGPVQFVLFPRYINPSMAMSRFGRSQQRCRVA